MPDNAKFCSVCGLPRSNDSSGRSYLDNTNNIIFRTGYNNSLLTKWIISICISIGFAIICFLVIQYYISYVNDLRHDYRITRYSKNYETLKNLTFFLKCISTFCIFEPIIFTFTAIINLIRIKKNYLVITNDEIYGIACPSFGYGTLNFNIRFDQISSVTIKSKHIIFTTNFDNKKYHCYVEDYAAARQIIKKILIGE